MLKCCILFCFVFVIYNCLVPSLRQLRTTYHLIFVHGQDCSSEQLHIRQTVWVNGALTFKQCLFSPLNVRAYVVYACTEYVHIALETLRCILYYLGGRGKSKGQ
jgi:hypothetical protein